MVSGRGHGKGSRGLGPGGQSGLAPYSPAPWRPHLMAQSQEACLGQEAAIVLLLAQSCVPFTHYFWPPEAEEKAKKGAAVLSGTLSWKRFQGLRGRGAVAVGSRAPVLIGAGGVALRGAREGTHGAPLAFLHPLLLTNCSDTQRNEAQHKVPPPVTRLL